MLINQQSEQPTLIPRRLQREGATGIAENNLKKKTMHIPNTTEKAENFPPWGDKRGASYFTISELTASATALREGIDNRPSKCAYHLLHVLVDQLLDPIREAWGEPIVVSSGYRCKELNDLVGGAKNSHHLLGCAADITVPQGGKKSSTMSEYLPLGGGREGANRRLFKLIQQMQQERQIRFTQLIWEGEGRWIHISYVPSDLRCQVIDA